MEAWLALRGLRTLHLRVERASANAADLAGRLAGHPACGRTRVPTTPAVGAIVAIEVRRRRRRPPSGSPSATRLWVHATSLGGVESQMERRRRRARRAGQVPENLMRLSVGIEDVDDLWRDLARPCDLA